MAAASPPRLSLLRFLLQWLLLWWTQVSHTWSLLLLLLPLWLLLQLLHCGFAACPSHHRLHQSYRTAELGQQVSKPTGLVAFGLYYAAYPVTAASSCLLLLQWLLL